MRAFKNVIEQAESSGYPHFAGHQTTAEEKVGECAAMFGGFAVYTDGKTAYILTVAMPYPEPVQVVGKLTGEKYDTSDDGTETGRCWMDIDDAIKVFRALADKLERKQRL